MEHLTTNASGITLTDDIANAPEQITDCGTCAKSKMTAQISRYPERSTPAVAPFERIAFDWIYMDEGYNNDGYITHTVCTRNRFHLAATHTKMSSYLEIFEEQYAIIELNWGFKIKYVQTDDFRNDAFDAASHRRGIIREQSAPGTQAQNGKAERAGRSITTVSRCLLHASGLPLNMWPEAVPHASRLLNLTPTKALDWKTPFEAVFKRKPDIRHLQRYGSRAYYFDKDIPKSQRLEKMLPRANIGYYVGYNSTNIYHIWIPAQEKVIRTRDVRFDPNCLFKDEPDDKLGISERVTDYLEVMTPLPQYTHAPIELDESLTPEIRETDSLVPEDTCSTSEDGYVATSDVNQQLPTPSPTPSAFGITPESSASGGNTPDASEASEPPTSVTSPHRLSYTYDYGPAKTILNDEILTTNRICRARHLGLLSTVNDLSGFHLGFNQALSFASAQTKLLVSSLLDPPEHWRQMLRHPNHQGFLEATQKEYNRIASQGTFEPVQASALQGQNPIPTMWVWSYKQNSDGHLTSYKARLVVQGDLQMTLAETAATTLAARIFRAMIAIIAYFGLEMRQFDVVNAFINAPLDDEVYITYPDGFPGPPNGYIRLRRALYGLKQSPYL
jgi:hypothetical protein